MSYSNVPFVVGIVVAVCSVQIHAPSLLTSAFAVMAMFFHIFCSPDTRTLSGVSIRICCSTSKEEVSSRRQDSDLVRFSLLCRAFSAHCFHWSHFSYALGPEWCLRSLVRGMALVGLAMDFIVVDVCLFVEDYYETIPHCCARSTSILCRFPRCCV